MTTTETRNDSIIRSRRGKLERLASSYAAALYETVAMLQRRGRIGQTPPRHSSDIADERLARMSA